MTGDAMDNMRITGDRIDLRPLTKSDMAHKVAWFNDPAVNKTLLLTEPLELEKTLQWFDAHKDDRSRCEFAVESKDHKTIGIIGFVHIDRTNETAECYCVIGDKSFWGKGVGTEAHRALIDWGFKNLGLHKVWADIRAENIAIVKVVEKLGFRVEGTLRNERLINGRRVDVVRIAVLKDEFYEACRRLK
jgi:RimJ/RimL family protein N-acetyltransferase